MTTNQPSQANHLSKSDLFFNKINNFFTSPKLIRVLEYCFGALACIQILMIGYLNLTHNQYHLGYDSSVFFTKIIEIVNQQTLFPDNWSDQTTLMLDSPILVAALLYKITGNLFVSYGISNLITLASLIIPIYWIFKTLELSRCSFLISLCFILSPFLSPFYYSNNSLDYFFGVFYNSAFYSVKLVTIILIIYTVLALEKGKMSASVIISGVFSIMLTFFSGLSSGLYLAVTIIIPVLFYYFLKVIINKELKQIWCKGCGFAIILIALLFVGKKIATSVIGFTSRESGSILVGANDFWSNLGSIILGILFFPGTMQIGSYTQLFSVEGLNLLINWALTIVIIASTIALFIIAKKKIKADIQFDFRKKSIILIGSFLLINFCIFFFCITKYGSEVFEERYLIPVFMVFFSAVGIAVSLIPSNFHKSILSIFILVALTLSNILSYNTIYKTDLPDFLFDIPAKLESYNVPFVYGFGSDMTLGIRALRAIDPSKKYKSIIEDGTVHHWGDYTYYDDNSEYEGQIILITTADSFAKLPSYISAQFTMSDSAGNIGIYIAEHNCFDLQSGFPVNSSTARELVYSSGMQCANGIIGNDGSFYSDGTEGFAIWGPYVNPGSQKYNLTLNYEVLSDSSDNIGTFDIACNSGSVQVASCEIDPAKTSAEIKDVSFDENMTGVEYRVYLHEGALVKISSIDITAQ